MKKVILSLAALAMISLGAVSCGSDDSNPGPGPDPNPNPNPGTEQADNTVRFNGVDSPLDASYYELITRNYTAGDSGETFEAPSIYQYPDGGYANGYYINVAYNVNPETGNADTYHYALFLVPNPSIVIEGENITDFGQVVLPHEAEDIFWAQAAVSINGEQFSSTQDNRGSGSVVVNTLVITNSETLSGTSNFVSQFTLGSDSFNFKYNGETFITQYNETPQQGGSSLTQKSLLRKDVSSSNIKKVDANTTDKNVKEFNLKSAIK